MASYFITGASRGLGLDLVRSLSVKPNSEVSVVFAAARTESENLKKLASGTGGRIQIVPLDVESEDSIKRAAAQVERHQKGKGLDVLVNVAGVMPHFPGGLTTVYVIQGTQIERLFGA